MLLDGLFAADPRVRGSDGIETIGKWLDRSVPFVERTAMRVN